MPARSSRTSSSSKKTTARSSTSRRKTARDGAAVDTSPVEDRDFVEEIAVFDDPGDSHDDFGAGLDDDFEEPDVPAKVRTKRGSKSEKPEAKTEPEDRSDDEPSAAHRSVSTDSEEETTDRPKRRRRRRRRKGKPEGAESATASSGSSGRSSRRGGGGQNGGRGRSRSTGRRGRSAAQQPQRDFPDVEGDIEGVLELHPKGYGFLRSRDNDFASQEADAFVSSSLVERYGLREGVLIKGEVGPGSRGQGPRLKGINTIDGYEAEEYSKVNQFDNLTPINPFEQIRLETGPRPITMRVMDLLTPIGKGQRALIVAPPRTGKTMLLQEIADSVSKNHPEVHLIVLLIDERPEEVTEMRRRVSGDVIASSMDRDVESHVRISQLIIERGKRLAEEGKDVFILLDSITRTARAFNKWVGNTGRTMSGGIDVKAMDIPKKMFGTARRFDEGGSLTVVGTALIETGSRMDEVIFQEFKGTGNMELVLSRELADRRIWPAIDIGRSGTRREEKILAPEVLEGVTMLRRSLISLSSVEAMDQLIRTLGKFDSNKEFLERVKSVL